MNSFIRKLLLFVISVNGMGIANGQNLETIGKEKPLTVTGSLSATNIFYSVDGMQSRRSPHSYFLNGNINFSLYGWSIPLSVNYSNQNASFTQPFNQYGASPTYKWITLHAGYRSINWSPYSLAGHTFLGGGFELQPSIFRLGFVYGRFNKAVPEDTLNAEGQQLVSYQRMGYAFKVGIGKDNQFIDMVLFKAKDDLNSIPHASDTTLKPLENIVVSINGSTPITKRVVLTAEYGTSAFTNDIRSNVNKGKDGNLFRYAGGLYKPRESSSFYNAFKTNITYTAGHYSINATYERIDPGYATLGSYFFNNDMENVTGGINTQLFKNKINVSANAGRQTNNLDGSKLTTLKRLIGSINLGYTATEKLNFVASYSNFTSTTRNILRNDPSFQTYDTLKLNFMQLTHNGNFNASYSMGPKEKKQGLNLNLAYQVAHEHQQESTSSVFYNANLSYRINYAPQGLGFNLGLNGTENQMAETSSTTLGPIAGITKSFLEKKLQISLNSSFNNVMNNGKTVNQIFSLRNSINYSYMKKHMLVFNTVLMRRLIKIGTGQSYTEFTGTLTYGYNF